MEGDSSRREPSRLGSLLKQLLKNYRPAVSGDPASRLQELNRKWRSVIGEPLATMTRVVKYRGGVLTVEVSSAPLIAELGGFARESLIEGMASGDEGALEGLHDIAFVHGSFGAEPDGNPDSSNRGK